MALAAESRLLLTTEGEAALLAEIAYLELICKEICQEQEHAQGGARPGQVGAPATGELAAVEAHIRRLRRALSQASRAPADCAFVTLGCEVEVAVGDGKRVYAIVCPATANPMLGRISYESPLGRSLLGLGVGDEVEVNLPEGLARLRVTAVRRGSAL